MATQALTSDVLFIFGFMGFIALLLGLWMVIPSLMDRPKRKPAAYDRSISVDLALGDDQKLQRLESKLQRRGIEIVGTEYRFDFANDREQVTFHVNVPNSAKQPPRLRNTGDASERHATVGVS
jgi:hypothetical protein